jgi:hypothetical protein
MVARFHVRQKSPPQVNLVLQHWCKALQSLALLHYSSTIRTIRRLFADYSYYSSTIRGLFVLFVAIRTIRFTILVLSITRSLINLRKLLKNLRNYGTLMRKNEKLVCRQNCFIVLVFVSKFSDCLVSACTISKSSAKCL